jgi:BirA family transcriptional regulator, biotin operon repressor / biotin---[acetyl-CoA-carboxylase] ligase
MSKLGSPHVHYASIGSTNDRARELAADGAPDGAIVTADEQTAGRGRRGRSWETPPGQALLLSILLRDPPDLLTLRVAVAVADACAEAAQIKWPNDVRVNDRKVAGILCEQQPGEDWAIAGIGVNVAVDLERMAGELHTTAGTLGREQSDIEPFRDELLRRLQAALELDTADLIRQWSARDGLFGERVEWNGGTGIAAGIDAEGRLLVDVDNDQVALDSGEVSLVLSA